VQEGSKESGAPWDIEVVRDSGMPGCVGRQAVSV
jgi:hypothetical protein